MPKETKLAIQRSREELRNRKVSIIIKSGDWSDTLENLIEQESWKRK